MILTSQSIELSQKLLNTVDNHLHSLESITSDLVIEQRLMKQKVDIFLSTFRWIFPSFLILIAVLAALISLIASGQMVLA